MPIINNGGSNNGGSNNNVIHAEQERGLSNIPPTQNAVTLSSVKINPNKQFQIFIIKDFLKIRVKIFPVSSIRRLTGFFILKGEIIS